MNATNLRFLSVPLAAVLLGACGERLDLEVKARIDGQPAAQATVVVDREQLGVTDAQGVLAKQIRKKAGAEIDVTVTKEMPGYRIEPWKSTVLVKGSEEHTSELQSQSNLVCRLLLAKQKDFFLSGDRHSVNSTPSRGYDSCCKACVINTKYRKVIRWTLP